MTNKKENMAFLAKLFINVEDIPNATERLNKLFEIDFIRDNFRRNTIANYMLLLKKSWRDGERKRCLPNNLYKAYMNLKTRKEKIYDVPVSKKSEPTEKVTKPIETNKPTQLVEQPTTNETNKVVQIQPNKVKQALKSLLIALIEEYYE